MKLPDYYDLYDHNKYLDKLIFAAIQLGQNEPAAAVQMTQTGKESICRNNLRQLKAIQAIILHLELAIEEILNVREQR